ncbi:MAG: NAD(P)-binding domain-containing protein [Acidobacteria bacterium]|nr:NAD(P)-binding domain-containing protein [Acidobacteriota bacterium]MBV9475118.1 NAD(P)-binding domain-containing protein [Acidobacteriota bacterium]
MQVAVVGSGRMGMAMGLALSRIGDDVRFTSRDPARVAAALRARGADLPAGPQRDACDAELIVLATGWAETRAALEAASPRDGTIVLTCVNPEPEDLPLAGARVTSAAEEIARWAPRTRVVEAFNMVYAEAVDLAPHGAPAQTVLYCGDDADARAAVADRIRRLGFDALDAGPLTNARELEATSRLLVYLVRVAGYGPLGIHPRWIRLSSPHD